MINDCAHEPQIAVGIATLGRPDILRATLDVLRRQLRRPDRIVLCAPGAEDIPSLDPDIEVVIGPRGLTRQRNAILDRLDSCGVPCDVVVFFDDDFIADPRYLLEMERVFVATPQIVLATGHVVADGIIGEGLSEAAALAILERAPAGPAAIRLAYSAYGCNMGVRLAPVRSHGIRFDESLPLYGWLEDVDFSGRMRPHGTIVTVGAARGVHLGVKSGRQSGRRLGYSQIANPVHLLRKGTFSRGRALTLMARNIAMNCLRAARPEPYVDRAGRLHGNLTALADLCRGRLDPLRIGEF